jgi:hypothetical protein
MHPGIREQKRDELSIHKDSTAEITLLIFLKPNPGIDLDYEIGESGIEIGAGLCCHIARGTFGHMDSAQNEKLLATTLPSDSTEHRLAVMLFKVLEQGGEDLRIIPQTFDHA